MYHRDYSSREGLNFVQNSESVLRAESLFDRGSSFGHFTLSTKLNYLIIFTIKDLS